MTAAFLRARRILTILAGHPDGVSAATLTAALWPVLPPDRVPVHRNITLSLLCHAVRTATDGVLSDIVLIDNDHYRLDPDLVTIDIDIDLDHPAPDHVVTSFGPDVVVLPMSDEPIIEAWAELDAPVPAGQTTRERVEPVSTAPPGQLAVRDEGIDPIDAAADESTLVELPPEDATVHRHDAPVGPEIDSVDSVEPGPPPRTAGGHSAPTGARSMADAEPTVESDGTVDDGHDADPLAAPATDQPFAGPAAVADEPRPAWTNEVGREVVPAAGETQSAAILRLVVLGPPRIYRRLRLPDQTPGAYAAATRGPVDVVDRAVDEPAAAPGADSTVDPAVAVSIGHTPEVGAGKPAVGPVRAAVEADVAGSGVDREQETEVTARFQPRIRELLVLLAVHPDGLTRDGLIDALWMSHPSARATNALNTALSRLRRAVHSATNGALEHIVTTENGRYQLATGLVQVDYARFAAAVAARRAASTASDRHAAHRRIVDTYTGVLADGLAAEWIDAARESARREVLEAVSALARSLVESDPEQTLDLLEIARTSDPYNEALYRDIMRLQARLGRLDAITRTLSLLTTRLAELGDQPTPETLTLARRLRHLELQRPDAAVHHDGNTPLPPAHTTSPAQKASA